MTLGGAPVAVERVGPVETRISPPPGSRVLTVRENANAGWSAQQDGADLESVVVDGWQQGWLTDGSDDIVVARFTPDTVYRAGLFAGGVLFVLLATLLLVPRRRWPGAALAPLGASGLSAVLLGHRPASTSGRPRSRPRPRP